MTDVNQVVLPDIDESQLAITLEIVSDGIWIWNANTNYVYRSPGWYTMLGYDVDSFENTVFTWERIIHKEDLKRVMAHFDDYITGKESAYKIQYRCRTHNNDYLWIEDRGHIVEWNGDGTVAKMIGAHCDINAVMLLQKKNELEKVSLQESVDERTRELIELNKQLKNKISEVEYYATTDSLTSLANRRHFEERLKTESARAKRFKEPFSLIALDLDNFKPVNDLYGHATGDLVLVRVADILLSNIREIDVAVRWGGDEFMILLPNTDLKQAKILAEKIRVLIDMESLTTEVSVTGSFGVAEFDDGEEAMRLTIKADKALYASKNAGRNIVSTEND